MISLILFLSSTVFVPLYSSLLIIPLLVSRSFLLQQNCLKIKKNRLIGYVFILVSVLFISIFNFIEGPVSELSIDRMLGGFPYIAFIFLSLIVARYINVKDLKFLQWFIVFEICVGIIEYLLGVSTFFDAKAGFYEFSDTNLFYQKRVYGFSSNSSVLAFKTVYLFTITTMNIKLQKTVHSLDKFFLSFVFIGLFITFNRTSIIAVIISSLVFYGLSLTSILLLTIPVTVTIYLKIDYIIEQFTRGRGSIDYSGRDEIFSYFSKFWFENVLTGNNGGKLFWDAGLKVWHAHNSYLEFLASNGLISSILFLMGMVIIFGRKTYIILPILILSLYQYAFLWGFNFYDLVVFSILYNYQHKKEQSLN